MSVTTGYSIIYKSIDDSTFLTVSLNESALKGGKTKQNIFL